MEQRLANTWHMTVNEKKFIETALLSDLRVDGRHSFDYRQLTINFGREDGFSEVQLGQTHVMAFVTAQLVQPYRDRPNEGSLAIFTEFSPMADPSFEAGRPGESAVELGRIIDRGLRESRAVDTESLCVLAGKLAWSIRVDIHILDNGGNLVDAANIAALAALMTFRRPECILGGEDAQEVIVQPPEVQEPLPLIVHHLPIAVTFAFISDDNIVVVDPTHYEEAIMRGRLTATINASGDICAIQKAGGIGIMQSGVMQCLRVAAVKAVDIASKIKTAVESYNTERAVRKVKRHSSSDALIVNPLHSGVREDIIPSYCGKRETEHHTEELATQGCGINDNSRREMVKPSSTRRANSSDNGAKGSLRGPSNWDPYLRGVDRDLLRISLASSGTSVPTVEENERIDESRQSEGHAGQVEKKIALPLPADVSDVGSNRKVIKTLKDAVKPKNKRKKKVSSTTNTS